MDPAYWDTMRWDNFRWDITVYSPESSAVFQSLIAKITRELPFQRGSNPAMDGYARDGYSRDNITLPIWEVLKKKLENV